MYRKPGNRSTSQTINLRGSRRIKTLFKWLTGLTIILILSTNTTHAHEFWLQPSAQQLKSPGTISLELRNGEHFLGESVSFKNSKPSRFDLISVQDSTIAQAPVISDAGDNSAIASWPLQRGFHIFRFESDAQILQHPNFASFEQFAAEEGLLWAANAHKERGLSEHRVTEQFRRFAKTLIAVGDARGIDFPSGLELELVAIKNPYEKSTVDLPIQLLYKGSPLAGAQISVFHRAQGQLDFKKFETDSEGMIRLPDIKTGRYLLSAVHLRPTTTQVMIETQAVWESLWSSLTFNIGTT